MFWLGLAAGLAILIVIFKIGVGTLQIRWLKEDGQPEVARIFKTFLIATWSGAAAGVIGAFTGIAFLKYAGFGMMGFAVLWMGWLLVMRERRRSNP